MVLTQKLCLALLLGLPMASLAIELPDHPDDLVAGVPVNYTESKVGHYQLPAPLISESGSSIDTPSSWHKLRRPELHRIFEEHQFGRAAERPSNLRFEITEGPTPALNAAALRKQVVINFGSESAPQTVEVLVYVPNGREKPAPLFLSISFLANNLAVDDADVHVGRNWDRAAQRRVPANGPSRFGKLPIRQIIEAGFGVATFHYTDVDIDAKNGIEHGVRQGYLSLGNSNLGSDEWGAIAGWAWGISRIIDYFEQDPLVDADRVAITGISRLGKTALWAGANDQRVAAVIASCSGEGGAALSRRNYGETIAHLASPQRYSYQFAGNYQKWADDPNSAPVDAHELISLIAPRPLLLQTGTEDKWSDPRGEFLAAKAATPVYELLGKSGIDSKQTLQVGELLGGELGYYMHEGGHGMVSEDWAVYLDFLRRYLPRDVN